MSLRRSPTSPQGEVPLLPPYASHFSSGPPHSSPWIQTSHVPVSQGLMVSEDGF